MFSGGLYATSLSLAKTQEELDIFIDEDKWDKTDAITETGRTMGMRISEYFATILLTQQRHLKMWEGNSTY